ncbi:ferredoxin [Lacticaseibacillus kribbianus]|uniref:ferredoxin n=1 Tax=Lacticaseibacillus kribbianus TaxID=2926292 RepID=UPI001CD78C07|nr:ferredoxin [Lacticaseibacillus kribbianus]
MTLYYGKVDQSACIACGRCQLLAPALFAYDAEGIASYVPDHNTGTQPLNADQQIAFTLAQRRCPTAAIQRAKTPWPHD